MKGLLYCFLMVIFSVFTLKAQLPGLSKSKSEQIKLRKLIVGYEEEDPKKVAALKKDTFELQRYRDQLEGRNLALRAAVESQWNLHTGIRYMNLSEARALLKKEKKKHVIIHYDVNHKVDPEFPIKRTRNGQPIGWYRDEDNLTLVYNYTTRQTYASNDALRLVLEVDKEKVIAFAWLSNFFPSKGDLYFATRLLQYQVNFYTASDKNNIGMLKNKNLKIHEEELKKMTFYIDKNDPNPPMTEIQLEKFYPYKLKSVFFDKIEQTWAERDSTIAIAVPFEWEKMKDGEKLRKRSHMIVNAGTGKIYCVDCLKLLLGEVEDPRAIKTFD